MVALPLPCATLQPPAEHQAARLDSYSLIRNTLNYQRLSLAPTLRLPGRRPSELRRPGRSS